MSPITCKSPRKERPRSPCRQTFLPLLWRLVTPSSALGTAGLFGDKLQVPHAPQVQSPSVGPLPTSLGSTSTHAGPVLPAASDTVPVTVKSLWFVLSFDRALAHSFETCRSDGHRPGSKQLLSDPPAAQPGQANPPPHRHCVPVTDTTQVLIPHLVLKPPHKPRVGRCVGALPPPGALKEVATGQGRRLGTRS